MDATHSPNDELTETLLSSIRAFGATDDQHGTILVSSAVLRHACNKATWATSKSWDEVVACAHALLDIGLVIVADDAGHSDDMFKPVPAASFEGDGPHQRQS